MNINSVQTDRFSLHLEQRDQNPPVDLYAEYLQSPQNPQTPILFLPGGPGIDHQKYKNDHLSLLENRNLIFWDPRGCGKSGPVDFKTYNMETYIDDAYEICQKLGLKKVILLGVSFGAMASLGFASKYPSIMEKLLVVSGAYHHGFMPLALQNVQEKGSNEQYLIAQKLFEGKLSQEEGHTFLKLLRPLYSYRIGLGEDVPPMPVSFSIDVCSHGFTTYLRTFDYTKECGHIQCPTLILAGQEDWVCDVSHSIEMAKLIPNNELHVFQKASHFLPLDVKDEYFEKLTRFLKP